MKNELPTIIFNYGKLSTLERQIIEYLYSKPKHECNGGYTRLTLELSRPKSHVSNVRKATRYLRDIGIVTLHVGDKYSYIELRGDWINSLYFAYDIDGVPRVKHE